MYTVFYDFNKTHYTKSYISLNIAIRKAKSHVRYTGNMAAIEKPNGEAILVAPINGDGFKVKGTALLESF